MRNVALAESATPKRGGTNHKDKGDFKIKQYHGDTGDFKVKQVKNKIGSKPVTAVHN